MQLLKEKQEARILSEMTILSGEDIKNPKVSAGDYCDIHHLGYIGPECPVCEDEVRMLAESAKAEEIKYISKK